MFFNTVKSAKPLTIITEKPLTTLLGSDAVDRVIAVALGTDTAADGNGGRLTLDGLSIGVNVGDLDLNGGVVLGRDETVWALDCCSVAMGRA